MRYETRACEFEIRDDGARAWGDTGRGLASVRR